MAAKNVPFYADPGTYIQTSFNVDVQKVDSVDVNSKDFKELLVRLYQDLNKMQIALNDKTSGYFPLNEFVTGSKFFPTLQPSTTGVINFRQEFVKVIDFKALPNAGLKSVAHGITVDANTIFTQIYATATKPTAPFEFIPIPYVFVGGLPGGGDIELWVDDTNVNIQTSTDMTAFSQCYVIVKWLKN